MNAYRISITFLLFQVMALAQAVDIRTEAMMSPEAVLRHFGTTISQSKTYEKCKKEIEEDPVYNNLKRSSNFAKDCDLYIHDKSITVAFFGITCLSLTDAGYITALKRAFDLVHIRKEEGFPHDDLLVSFIKSPLSLATLPSLFSSVAGIKEEERQLLIAIVIPIETIKKLYDMDLLTTSPTALSALLASRILSPAVIDLFSEKTNRLLEALAPESSIGMSTYLRHTSGLTEKKFTDRYVAFMEDSKSPFAQKLGIVMQRRADILEGKIIFSSLRLEADERAALGRVLNP